MKRNALVVGLFGVCALLGALFFIIPSLGGRVFLSPDETANAVAARAFARQGSMRVEDAILKDGPWLRPRSFVTQGGAMVPVGFLGLSVFLGSLFVLFGNWALILVVPLLAMSAAYPLWRFSEKFGKPAQWVAVLVWLSFPTVILYANRGLFPNLPAVCLMLWAMYVLWSGKKLLPSSLVSGLLFGLAVAIRPTELVWMVPWVALVWIQRNGSTRSYRQLGYFVLAALVPMGVVAFVAWKTYGSPFAVGYFLHDPIDGALAITQTPGVETGPHSVIAWPFGFHPRNVWFNVKHYIFGIWGAWTVITLAAAALFWKQKRARLFIAVGTWTLFVSAMMYGQAIYQDHVGVNVISTGNSFLRYLLPLAPIFAFSIAAFCSKLFSLLSFRKAMACTVLLCGVCIALGIQLSFRYDNENVWDSAQELQRYLVIRETTYEQLGTQAIVLSERSDKIFFPLFRVTSPLPSFAQISDLVAHVSTPVVLFATTLDQKGMQPWTAAGLALSPVFSSTNQTMYRVSFVSTTTTP